ncbi:glycosyltransferase [Nocardioides sp. SYSU DS0663]|uniref:glycosyltransferase n=1 Tax=Nocardioides sp. SYSU DS0663 TaxID=3416445 RepID=UPI003F4B4511
MRPHAVELVRRHLSVGAMAAGREELEKFARATNTIPLELAMSRQVSLLRDIAALYRAVRHLRHHRPRIVNYGTPKAAVVVGVAAFICRVPVRIYTVHGLRYETATGFRRWLLVKIEVLACSLSTKVVTVSRSVADELIAQGQTSQKVKSPGPGSISGVDADKYARDENARRDLRAKYRLEETCVVSIFIGRIAQDKGMLDLANAWASVSEVGPSQLWILGRMDGSSRALEAALDALKERTDVHFFGHVDDIVPFLSAADMLIHPSHREGFGNVIIEAAAAGLPAVTYRVTGCKDAVEDGVTGIMARQSVDQLASAWQTLSLDHRLRKRLGKQASDRVRSTFDTPTVVSAHLREYRA